MSDRNEELRKKITAMRKKHPHRSAADMARELGVSRQRVSKLLRDLGLPTVTRYDPT